MANIFEDISAPYINSVTLKRVLSPKVKENIFQNIMVKPDEAVTEKFSEDTDAAEIQVLRVIPQAIDVRELGAETNGSFFNGNAALESSTQAYGIQILQTIDQNIDIPTNSQDMISVDLVSAEVKNLAGLVSRNINAISLAAMLAKNFNNVAGFDQLNSNASATTLSEATPNNWVTLAPDGSYTDAIFDALANLDNGNEEQGIDSYPDDQRAIFIRPTIKAAVLKNMIGLYGGTGVFDILQRGGLDRNTKPEISTTGYVGEIGGVPVYCLSAVGWALIEKYLGLTSGTLNNLAAIVCSGVGTGRALAFNSVIKIVDSQSGQGLRIQPKYRFGAECWDPLSVVPIFSQSFTNPVTQQSNTLYVRGSGSRN